MAWSEAARKAALEARRAHSKAKGKYGKGSGTLGQRSWAKYATPKARQSLATAIRNMRAGRTSGSFNSYSASGLNGKMAMAVQSTRARNYLRLRKK